MDPVSRFGEVLDGYSDLVDELQASWAQFLNGISTKLAAGPYGPDDAAADFPAAVQLALESMIAVGSEAFDALSIMTSSFSEKTTEGGLVLAKSNLARALTVKADFVSVTGEVLPKDQITISPDQLPPGETQFALEVNTDGVKARTYDGWVVATPANGKADEVRKTVTIG